MNLELTKRKKDYANVGANIIFGEIGHQIDNRLNILCAGTCTSLKLNIVMTHNQSND